MLFVRGKFSFLYVDISFAFFYLGFLSRPGLQCKGDGISLTPHYHFHPLHRHLDITLAIAARELASWVAAGLEPGTFGFRALVAIQ